LNYNIFDIEGYFLLISICFSFFALVGILALANILKQYKVKQIILVLILLMFVILEVFQNFNKVDRSKTYIFEDYTKSLLNSVEQNAVIFTFQWDLTSSSYYFQNVENFRKDVSIISTGFFFQNWHQKQIQNNYPYLFKEVKNESINFITSIKPFDEMNAYDEKRINETYLIFIKNLIEKNLDERPVYIAPEVVANDIKQGQFTLPNGAFLVPDLFLFKVVKSNEYLPLKNINFNLRFNNESSRYIQDIKKVIGYNFFERIKYEMSFNKKDNAKAILIKLKKLIPDLYIPTELEFELSEVKLK
ncbi:MAG: hypothetical protein N3A61_03055, partial [Ignavibacteria bacterium]|nr:hypothetical protein [Ignavibacteria bacterium]